MTTTSNIAEAFPIHRPAVTVLTRQQEDARTERLMSREDYMRFAYVPFVIAQLTWDYADTVADLAASLRIPGTKKLNRRLRALKQEYDWLRRPYIDSDHCASEVRNGLVFEQGVAAILSQMRLNLRLDLADEHPTLTDDERMYLIAVHQCGITLSALRRYVSEETRRVAALLDRRVGDILPPQLHQLGRMLPGYLSGHTVSDRFRRLRDQYVDTLATQIALVKFNLIADGDD